MNIHLFCSLVVSLILTGSVATGAEDHAKKDDSPIPANSRALLPGEISRIKAKYAVAEQAMKSPVVEPTLRLARNVNSFLKEADWETIKSAYEDARFYEKEVVRLNEVLAQFGKADNEVTRKLKQDLQLTAMMIQAANQRISEVADRICDKLGGEVSELNGRFTCKTKDATYLYSFWGTYVSVLVADSKSGEPQKTLVDFGKILGAEQRIEGVVVPAGTLKDLSFDLQLDVYPGEKHFRPFYNMATETGFMSADSIEYLINHSVSQSAESAAEKEKFIGESIPKILRISGSDAFPVQPSK